MKLFQILIPFFLLCLIAACKEDYYPKVVEKDQGVLIVEGLLNTGNAASKIKISRSVKLYDTLRTFQEHGATVTVESDAGETTLLPELGDTGAYIASPIIEAGQTYKLRITTANQQTYESDFISVITNPSIDSVNWKRDETSVTIFVNTHNPQNNTKYYRWEYDETWEIRSRYFADPAPDDGLMEVLYPGENIYNCWKFYNSSQLMLATTTNLSSDIISDKPLMKILDGDDRLSVRYRMAVRQYALDKTGYEFYQMLKKNTESIGSIFDAQPTELVGNIHSVAGTVSPAIGYISAGRIDSTVIWIDAAQIPNWKPWADCTESKFLNSRNDDITAFTADHTWLIYAVVPFSGVYVARAPCVSCRLRGGSTHKPSYW